MSNFVEEKVCEVKHISIKERIEMLENTIIDVKEQLDKLNNLMIKVSVVVFSTLLSSLVSILIMFFKPK